MKREGRAIAAVAIIMACAITGLAYHMYKMERALGRELRPYVERVDGKSGLSRTDVLDFARRAELH